MCKVFLLVTVSTIVLAGSQRAENANADANVAIDPDFNRRTETNAKLTCSNSPADPNQPDPATKGGSLDAAGLLAEVARFGGYRNSFGRTNADPLHIMFRSPGPKDEDLEKLRPMFLKSSVLIKLNLNGCGQITDLGLAHLADIPAIRQLAIENRNKKVTDAGLKPISTLTDLEELSISGDAITDAGLAHFSKLTKLRTLSVYSKGTTDAGYAHLANLVNLEEIFIGNTGNEMSDECLSHMKGMIKLKALTLRQKVTDAGLAHVKNLVGLRELTIESSKISGAGLANLSPLTQLQKLTINAVANLKGDSLTFLAGMTGLRELEINSYSYALDRVGANHIGKLAGLKKLKPGRVENGALEGIAGLTGLEELSLGNSQVGDADMKYLSGLTSLRTLYLFNTRVTDEGIKQLATLKKLQMLAAEDNNLTDASLIHIAMLTDLKSLGLTQCKITGSGLKELAKLTKLERLWLNGNPVVDEYLMSLKDVSSLKWVNLTGTMVSDEVALELKKARPKLALMDSAGDDVTLNKKPTPPKRAPAEDVTKIEPSFKLSAEEYHKEFKTRDQAVAKYKGKVIELSGVVSSLSRNDDGQCSLTLKVGKEFIGVFCYLVDERPWVKVVKGQNIKIKGKCPEMAFLALLTDCVFVETGVYKGISITVDELAKEYADNPEATQKKYAEKHLVLSGEVVSREFNSAGAATVVMKTDGKVKIKCIFPTSEKIFSKPLKAGQKLTVVGEASLNSDKEITLYYCLPMP